MINRATKEQAGCPEAAAVPPPVTVSKSSWSEAGEDPIAFTMLQDSLGKEAALEILHSFLGYAAEVMVELQTAIREKNSKAARTALTELGKSCSVVGASSLLKGCILMEEELKTPNWSRIDRCMNALIAETRQTGQFISELLS